MQDEYEPCSPKIFTINEIYADPDDFGEVSKLTGDFCCKYREFKGFEEPSYNEDNNKIVCHTDIIDLIVRFLNHTTEDDIL